MFSGGYIENLLKATKQGIELDQLSVTDGLASRGEG